MELILFIVVMGILSVELTLPFSVLLSRAHDIDQQTQAIALAQAGIEYAIGRKRLDGFDELRRQNVLCRANRNDVRCQSPDGSMTVSVVVTDINDQFKEVVSTVSGSSQVTLSTIVSRY